MPWTNDKLSYLSSTFTCPKVTLDCIYAYFQGDGDSDSCNIHPSALKMYKQGWLVSCMTVEDGNKHFLQCQVMSEMTKRTRYRVKVVITPTGVVVNSHCECTAGAGDKAKCKHVAVVLFGLEGLARTGRLTMQKSCTDLPQQWHQPAKVHTGSPAKAKKIQYKAASGESNPDAAMHEQSRRIIPGEHDRIMSIIQNFQVSLSLTCWLVSRLFHEHYFLL